MGCSICGRSSCAKYMHSLDEQERFNAIASRDAKIEELKARVFELESERARHAREIERARLEAKIEALDDLWCTTKRYERGRTEECAWMVGVTPYSVRMDVETLAAALAALEVKGE